MHRLKARLAHYLETNQNLTEYHLTIIPTLQYGDLLFVRAENSAELIDYLLHDELFVRFTAGIYRCQYTTKMLSNITLQFSENDTNTYRLQLFPKSKLEDVIDTIPENVTLDPKKYTHIIQVVYAYNRYHFGITKVNNDRPMFNVLFSELEEVVCRAYYKLAEFFIVESVQATPNMKAIDIGAAPGGWSSYLATRGIRTLAVDPGALRIEHELITHVQKRVEDATEEIEQFGQFDLCVCDMNMHPTESAEIVLKVAKYLKPNALLVMTVKECEKNQKNKMYAQVNEMLRDEYTDLKERHLLSNKRERTLYGYKK
jgi:23S rRNA (cytidine2498-2'-O)-methyltransferase